MLANADRYYGENMLMNIEILQLQQSIAAEREARGNC